MNDLIKINYKEQLMDEINQRDIVYVIVPITGDGTQCGSANASGEQADWRIVRRHREHQSETFRCRGHVRDDLPPDVARLVPELP